MYFTFNNDYYTNSFEVLILFSHLSKELPSENQYGGKLQKEFRPTLGAILSRDYRGVTKDTKGSLSKHV